MRTVLTVTAPAKVNLYLGVGSRRSDGYHDVTTVLHALELADEVQLEPAPELSLSGAEELGIPAEQNLAWRAAIAFAEAFGVRSGVHIALHKCIPQGAGLGGGSSDAAAVLAGLAHSNGVSPSDPRLVAVARTLGADAPFFLEGGCALFAGRGDELARRMLPLDTPVALLKPPEAVATAAAYTAFDATPEPARDAQPLLYALEVGDLLRIGTGLANNMEAVAATLVPQTAEALGWVRAADGVLGAALAGSGSAMFALCDSRLNAAVVAERAAALGWWSAVTRLSSGGVTVSEGQGLG